MQYLTKSMPHDQAVEVCGTAKCMFVYRWGFRVQPLMLACWCYSLDAERDCSECAGSAIVHMIDHNANAGGVE